MEAINANAYAHKKFSVLKRKRSQDFKEDEVVFVMATTLTPPAKRRQSTSFFRPWLDQPQAVVVEEEPSRRAGEPTPTPTPSIQPQPMPQYHANMVRSHTPRQRSPQEQLRRDRNTLASLRNRRAKQAEVATMERQYQQYRAQHAAMLEQQVRLSLLYVRVLQQTAHNQPLAPSSHQQHLQQQEQQRRQQQLANSQLLRR